MYLIFVNNFLADERLFSLILESSIFKDFSCILPMKMGLMREVLLTDNRGRFTFGDQRSKGRFVDGVFEGFVSCSMRCDCHSTSSSGKVSLIVS